MIDLHQVGECSTIRGLINMIIRRRNGLNVAL